MVKRSEQNAYVQVWDYFSNKHEFRYNTITGNVEFRSSGKGQFSPLGDYDINSLIVELAEKGFRINNNELMVLLKSSKAERFDPIMQYYQESPPWDGKTDYIGQLANTVQTTNPEHWEKYFRKWFVALVASNVDETVVNQTMLVLSGKQGVGKTTWLHNLLPKELQPYAFTGSLAFGNKDTDIYLAQSILITLDEFSVMRKRDQEKLKELITRPTITVRRPYERVPENLPRRASFCASTNDDEFLFDLNGNRRFLCFEVESIDYENEVNIQQAHAQAFVLARSGFQFWIDQSDFEEITSVNEGFTEVSLEEEMLIKYFEPCVPDEATHILSTTEIAEAIATKQSRFWVNNSSIKGLGIALRKHKYTRLSRDGRKKYALKARTS